MSYEYTVEVKGLVARYGDRTVLRGVDLAVRPGEVHVILGGSGCGKSTLLKHILGLYDPAEGSVKLLGTELTTAEEAERELLLSRIGMLFQGGALLNSLSLHDNVALPIRERTELHPEVISEMVEMKLALVGLGHASKLFPPQLSGGMKKRAALARAMALDPAVLFCDEPSAGLDPITASALDDLILGLKARFQMSVVVVTHELPSIDKIADRVTMLHEGQVIAQGSLAEAKQSPHPMVKAFFSRESEREDEAAKTSVQDALEGRLGR